MSNFSLRKAERKQAKLKIGIFGPSGSGKTMSSLLLARGMTDSWEKVAIIDTENNSADLYSHIGDYNVLPLTPPFTPERYIEAIKACEEAGMDVIVIDSISHEWEGKGGILEIAEEQSKGAKNSFGVWGKLTPRHNAFISSILQANCHIVCCGRSKQDYVLNQQERNGKTINVPEKVGLKAVTREGFDYEMTIAFDIMINHFASVSKDRTSIFKDRPEFKISQETGEEIIEWNKNGAKSDEEKQQENFKNLFEIFTTKTNTKEIFEKEVKEFRENLVSNPKYISKAQLDELSEIIKNLKISFEEEVGEEKDNVVETTEENIEKKEENKEEKNEDRMLEILVDLMKTSKTSTELEFRYIEYLKEAKKRKVSDEEIAKIKELKEDTYKEKFKKDDDDEKLAKMKKDVEDISSISNGEEITM